MSINLNRPFETTEKFITKHGVKSITIKTFEFNGSYKCLFGTYHGSGRSVRDAYNQAYGKFKSANG